MGCHGNGKIICDPNESFFDDILFLIYLVKVNNLTPMRYCPGECKPPAYRHFYAILHRANIFPVLKMGEVILNGKEQENETDTSFLSMFYVELILLANLKHLMCIGMPLVNQKMI